jgi:hypothetical protein
MSAKKVLYKSYLIRICNNESSQTQRVVVTRINEEGEQENFTSIDELMIFLLYEMDEPKEEND